MQKKPPLKLQTTTLWYYPSQQHTDEPLGDPRYPGRTPTSVIWNLLERYTRSHISKLLHHPTVCIKDLDRSTADGIAKLSAVRDLFQLPQIDQTDTSDEPDDRGRS